MKKSRIGFIVALLISVFLGIGAAVNVKIFEEIICTGNMSAATYGSDSSITDAELLYINTLSSNAQTQLNAKVPITSAAAIAIGSTGAGVNITTHTDAGDDFTVNTSMLVVEGDTGNVGIGTTGPNNKLSVNGNIEIGIDAHIYRNAYYSDTYRYTANGYAAVIDGASGKFIFYTAPSGTAGAVATIYSRFLIANDGTVTIPGNVGIGTTAPANPLAVNRQADDGVVIDIEQADIVEGTISVSTTTVSYNAFVGSHYTQLKPGQTEPPIGAVVVSTGEIIPCSVSKQKFTKVQPIEAVTIIPKVEAVEIKNIEVEDKDNIVSEETTYAYDPETDTEKPTITYTYGTKTVQKKRLKEGVHFHEKTRTFYTINAGYVKKEDGFYKEETVIEQRPLKEYFVYMDTTSTAADTRVYGVWLGKMSDDAKGMSFGEDSKAVYLVAQVGLFKIRVTDTGGNIPNGAYLETSTRPMEAQRQVGGQRLNSTIAKAMIDVDWATVTIDPVLGYKVKLIPCTF